jgi:hypothetical protein
LRMCSPAMNRTRHADFSPQERGDVGRHRKFQARGSVRGSCGLKSACRCMGRLWLPREVLTDPVLGWRRIWRGRVLAAALVFLSVAISANRGNIGIGSEYPAMINSCTTVFREAGVGVRLAGEALETQRFCLAFLDRGSKNSPHQRHRCPGGQGAAGPASCKGEDMPHPLRRSTRQEQICVHAVPRSLRAVNSLLANP